MKRINIDEKSKNEIIAKFIDFIQKKNKFTESSLSFTTKLDLELAAENRPTLYISANAYLKMMLYVRDTDIEIAWHGTVERNIKENWYYIKDVFLYPQTITSVTVNTDQEKYQNWLINLDDDTANNMRYQGHSHVNMGVTPSGTDMAMYEDFLGMLPKDDYYIFTIMNKSGTLTVLIYDLAKNVIYETKDVDVCVLTENEADLIYTIEQQKKEFCERTTVNYPKTYNTKTSYNNLANYPTDDAFYDDYYGFPKTQTDKLFDEIDTKFKNVNLKKSKKEKKKK